MMSNETKLTVILETRTSRRTFVYPRVLNLQFEESFPEPLVGGYRDGAVMYRPEQTHIDASISMVALKGEDGNFRTALLEELDPVPDEIRDIVTKATRHNVNDENREKLIKALTKLVEQDRKEKTK